MVGTSIGKYRLVALLGSGTMGIVYKAVDGTLDREVAIKILNPELADADLMRRFRAEATALAKLNHPEIATIHDLLIADHGVAMVMELVRGESLDGMLERLGPLPPERVAYLVDRVLSALDHAHLSAIVHRDIKPANVMLTAHGGIKIMDFGVAFIRDAETGGAAGGMVGTPAYMAPEQILGHEVDGRADLYAVGVMFYRLLTGAFPFDADTMEEMLRKQLADLPRPLSQHRDGLPDWCDGIVQRALAKSPADRFQTASEFRSALKHVTSRAPERTYRLSPSEYGRLGLASAPLRAVTSRAHAALAQRWPMVAWAGAAIAAIAIVVIALVYSTPWRGAPDRQTRIEPSANSPAASAVPLDTRPTRESDAARGAPGLGPLVFDAKALVGIGDKQRERDVNVQFADDNLTVMAAAFPNDVVHRLAYEAIVSIAYSRSRHPLWISANGRPARAAQAGRVLGIFPRSRLWVTLQSNDAADSLFVLRLENDAQVNRVVRALEERTGVTATRVIEPKDAK